MTVRHGDHTNVYAVGTDFNTGAFSHSIRFGYTNFHNIIGDGSGSLPSSQNLIPGLAINIGIAYLPLGNRQFCSGPNFLAPHKPISDKQIKYDGSRILGSHIRVTAPLSIACPRIRFVRGHGSGGKPTLSQVAPGGDP